MAVTLYGFKGCDTVKKARAWLESRGIAHEFFDYRLKPLDAATVDDWIARAGWEAVFNRNSTSFKELPEPEKAKVGADTVHDMILAQANFIKRPVLDTGDRLLFGFKADAYAEAVGGR